VEQALVDELERARLVAAYMAYCRAKDDSPEQDAHFWAMDAFYEIGQHSPLLCLQLCEDMLSCNIDDDMRAVLAAGPLEDALAAHGPAIIDEVERRAGRNPKFRHLLGGVWKSEMSDAIWERICNVRGTAW
jgi:hypothetical protein